RDTARMERAHRQLRARLADGLRGDDADRFAQLDARAGGEIAPVTIGANAMLAFAREHGTNLDPLDAGVVDGASLEFINLVIRLRENIFRIARLVNVVAGAAADQAIAELHDFVFTFVNRLHPDAVGGAAIVFTNDHVLRHIDQLAGHITR